MQNVNATGHRCDNYGRALEFTPRAVCVVAGRTRNAMKMHRGRERARAHAWWMQVAGERRLVRSGLMRLSVWFSAYYIWSKEEAAESQVAPRCAGRDDGPIRIERLERGVCGRTLTGSRGTARPNEDSRPTVERQRTAAASALWMWLRRNGNLCGDIVKSKRKVLSKSYSNLSARQYTSTSVQIVKFNF